MKHTKRRTFVKLAGAAAIAPAVAGCTGDSEGPQNGDENGNDDNDDGPAYDYVDDEPDYGDWFGDVGNYEGTVDWTGESEVTVANGAGPQGYQYEPPAIAVDEGTTVVWEWTGDGGAHTVTHEDGEFESELAGDEGFTFEQTFEEEGVYLYYCEPHRNMGQKGAVVVR